MLLTKLHVPSPGSNIVHRPHLIEKLNSGLERKLILVSAPAGFGKTTLICDWLDQSQVPAAWVSLDRRDNEPTEFLRYLIAGLQTIDPDIGKNAFPLLLAPQPPESESIIALLLNDLIKYGKSLILVLDDFHLIQSLEIIEIMKFIMDHLTQNLHLVVCSRSDPPLSISRLRSQNELVEIRAADLSFTVNDSYQFLNKKLKLNLSIDDVELLETKTEGWIAGLQLSAISMMGREDLSEFVRTLTGDNRFIMDYLLEEVLNMQSAEIKEFLIKTSILEQVSGELADFLLGSNNSQSILQQLERSNLFIIPLDEQRKWYRYHHLFADLLRQRLNQFGKEVIIHMHTRACDWYAKNGFNSLAIEHAIEAGNYQNAMNLLNDSIEGLWKSGQHTTILKFGDLLSQETTSCNPNFCLYYAWSLNSAGHLEKAEKVLASAEKLVLADLPSLGVLYGKISVAYTYLLSSSRNTERIFHYCKQARKYLTEDDPLWYSWAWLSYGVACVYTDRLQESGEAFEKSFNYGKKSGNIYIMTTAVTRLVYGKLRLGEYSYSYGKCEELLLFFEKLGYAEVARNEWANSGLFAIYGYIHYMWNKLEEALSLVELGYELSKKGNDFITRIFATLLYGWLLLMHGEKIKAETLISALERSIQEKGFFHTLPFSLTGQIIKIYIKLNRLDRARELIKILDLSLDKEINYLDEMAYISYVRYLIATSDYKDAEILLKKLEILGEPAQRVESLIEVKILGATLYNILEEKEKAIQYLEEALNLGEKENLIMFFVEDSEEIGELLKGIKPTKKFLDRINRVISKKEKGNKNFFKDPLSKREIEVLRYMVEDLSNQEIADKLFVSINTIKTHAKNIHLKLEVKNRSGAVAKAREMGLV